VLCGAHAGHHAAMSTCHTVSSTLRQQGQGRGRPRYDYDYDDSTSVHTLCTMHSFREAFHPCQIWNLNITLYIDKNCSGKLELAAVTPMLFPSLLRSRKVFHALFLEAVIFPRSLSADVLRACNRAAAAVSTTATTSLLAAPHPAVHAGCGVRCARGNCARSRGNCCRWLRRSLPLRA
jgi:hypothetical protein